MDLRKIVDNQRAKMIAAGLKGLEKMDVDALTFEAGMLGCNDAAHVSILMLTRLGESETRMCTRSMQPICRRTACISNS